MWSDDWDLDMEYEGPDGVPFEPIRIEDGRPIFDDKQILTTEQLVPGMILEAYAFYNLYPREIVIIDRPYSIHGSPVAIIHDKYGFHEDFLTDRSIVSSTGAWNRWHFWVDTGRRVDDFELARLQQARKSYPSLLSL